MPLSHTQQLINQIDKNVAAFEATLEDYKAGSDASDQFAVASFLTDMLHFTTRNSIDFEECLTEARNSFRDEAKFITRD
jgi:hypothetical protein